MSPPIEPALTILNDQPKERQQAINFFMSSLNGNRRFKINVPSKSVAHKGLTALRSLALSDIGVYVLNRNLAGYLARKSSAFFNKSNRFKRHKSSRKNSYRAKLVHKSSAEIMLIISPCTPRSTSLFIITF